MGKYKIEFIAETGKFKQAFDKIKKDLIGFKNKAVAPFQKAMQALKKSMGSMFGVQSKFRAAIRKTVDKLIIERRSVLRLASAYSILRQRMASARSVRRGTGHIPYNTVKDEMAYTYGKRTYEKAKAGRLAASGLTAMQAKPFEKEIKKGINAIDKFEKKLFSTDEVLKRTNKTMGKTAQRTSLLNTKFGSFAIVMSGLAATIFVFQNIVRAVRAVMSVGIDFEHIGQRMATSFRLTTMELKEFQDAAKAAARQGVISHTEAMKKMNELVRDGLSAEEAIRRFKEQMTWEASAMGSTKKELGIFLALLRELAQMSFDATSSSFNKFLKELNSNLRGFIDDEGKGFLRLLIDYYTWITKTFHPFAVYIKYVELLGKGVDGLKQKWQDRNIGAGAFGGIADLGKSGEFDYANEVNAYSGKGGLSPDEQRKLAEEAKKLRLKVTEEMYTEMKSYSENYWTWKEEQLNAQITKYGEIVNNEVLLEEYKTHKFKELAEQRKQANIAALEKEGTITAGLQLGIMDVMQGNIDITQNARDLTVSSMNQMADAVAGFASGASQDWESLAKDIVQSITKMIIKMLIMLAVQKALSSYGSWGKGGTFSGDFDARSGSSEYPNTWNTTHAKGSVVNSKKYFRFAGGTGLMGEAGSEAIMPLKRDSQGRLGVTAEGGAQTIVPPVIVNVYNNTDKETETTTESEFNGQEYVVNVWLDAYNRNKYGMRDMLGAK